MAQTKTGTTASTNTRTAQEMQEWFEKNKNNIDNYFSAKDGLRLLRDVTKTSNITVSTFNKEEVVSYLQNIGSNEINMRRLSRSLYWRSMIYYILVNFFAAMFELDCRSVIPNKNMYSPIKESNKSRLLKNYYDTVNWLDAMHLTRHMYNPLIVAFREDVSYNLYWLDETGMTIIPFDGEYARIDGKYHTGNYSFSIDMSWFRARQELLEFWGEPFISLYKEYDRTRIKWQHVPEEHSLCLKYNSADYNLIAPPLMGLFLSLISLEDLGDLTAIKDEQDIYKLLIYKLKGLSGAKDSDKFEVSPQSGAVYFKQFINDALPSTVSAAMMPGSEDVQVISFDDDTTTDTNKMSKALTTLLSFSGGGELLDSGSINSAAAFELAKILNTNFAVAPLLPQIEGWVEMALDQKLTQPCKVKFHKVSSYTKKDFVDKQLEAAQNGLPTVLTLASAMNGYSERDTMALNEIQNLLNIPDIFKPLQTSYVQSGKSNDEGGRPKTDDTELSPSGDRTRNQ